MDGDLAPAAIYVRASTEMQKYSTANQTEALRTYAGHHNLQIVRMYEDDGRSGLTLEGRSGLRQLIQDALSPKRPFEVLLVYDISRWGRFQDTDESAHYEFLCRRSGLRVIYAAEPFDNDGTPLANIMKAIKRTMAAEYSRELSEKVVQGKKRLAGEGFAMAAPGYGMRRLLVDQNGAPKGILSHGERKALQTDHVVLVPGPPKEVAIVRRIFSLYAHYGMGFTDIANYLNKHDVLNNSGGPWSDLSVKHLLQNEAYIGNAVYGRTARRLKGKIEPVPAEQWVRRDGAFPSIVPKRTFRLAQKRMANLEKSRTDDYFLIPLKALYEREGYLTTGLIDAQPNMPSARSYKWRFRGITNAYVRVGFVSPQSEKARWARARGREPDREALLEKLKELLDREGYITGKLLNADSSMPNRREVQWAFDNLRTAYGLICYEPQKSAPGRPRHKCARPSDSANDV